MSWLQTITAWLPKLEGLRKLTDGMPIARIVKLIGIGVALWWLYSVLIGWPKAEYARGYKAGQQACADATTHNTVTQLAEGQANVASQAHADLQHGHQAATANERAQTRIVTIYRQLESEARHAPPDPVDSCQLPPDRLRLWAAANAGPHGPAASADQGTTAGQPHTAAASAATTDFGPGARSGAEPPPGGAGLPPTGSPLLRPAAASGD